MIVIVVIVIVIVTGGKQSQLLASALGLGWSLTIIHFINFFNSRFKVVSCLYCQLKFQRKAHKPWCAEQFVLTGEQIALDRELNRVQLTLPIDLLYKFNLL